MYFVLGWWLVTERSDRPQDPQIKIHRSHRAPLWTRATGNRIVRIAGGRGETKPHAT